MCENLTLLMELCFSNHDIDHCKLSSELLGTCHDVASSAQACEVYLIRMESVDLESVHLCTSFKTIGEPDPNIISGLGVPYRP